MIKQNANKKAEDFYSSLIDILLSRNLSFMIGGTYALTAYTGIFRPTKDLDIFVTPDDCPKALKACSEAGYSTEMLDESWLAKVYDKEKKYFADIIFVVRNSGERVNKSWVDRSRQGEVLGHMVKLVPVEEMICSKAYMQKKERYDGSDVINLVLQFGKTINWHVLKEKMEPHWEIVFAHLINFTFVYPNELDKIPFWLINEYMDRFKNKFAQVSSDHEQITQGLIISSQYKVAVEKWGYRPISAFFPKPL